MHENNEISTEETTSKRSKLEEDGEILLESGRYHTQTEYSHNAQKRKGTDEKSVNARVNIFLPYLIVNKFQANNLRIIISCLLGPLELFEQTQQTGYNQMR